jgi:transposase-like protein/IS1 family transposase
MARRPKPVHQMTIPQFEAMFPDEDACKAYLVARRWGEEIHCPRCGAVVTHPVKSMPFKWQCYSCAPNSGYRFSHLTGTIFENTNKPLREWFRVVHLMLTSKKGMSALQIQRVMGFGSYETAWSMCHKIRTALVEPETKLGGIVEVDETFIGGKEKNRHWEKKTGGVGGQVTDKFVVIGAVKRKGNVIARMIDRTDTETFEAFVHEAVSDKVSLLTTDEHSGYRNLRHTFPHAVIRHGAGQYVIGAVHTNTIEGFWSILKRGVVGTFHKVSKKYLPLYVAEFQFRYNRRANEDIFSAAISGC